MSLVSKPLADGAEAFVWHCDICDMERPGLLEDRNPPGWSTFVARPDGHDDLLGFTFCGRCTPNVIDQLEDMRP